MFKNHVFLIIFFLFLNSSAENLNLKVESVTKNDSLLLTDNNEPVIINDNRFKDFPPAVFKGYTIIGDGHKKDSEIYLNTIDSLIEPCAKELKKNTGIGVIHLNCCNKENELIIYEDSLGKTIQYKMKLEWDYMAEKMSEARNIFNPFCFTIINGLYMRIRVMDEKKDFCKVITHEDKGKTGWIKKSDLDSCLIFRTWEQDLKKISFGVRHKYDNYTHFYKEQSFFSDTIKPKFGNIMPVEINGVWLKAVEYSPAVDIENPRHFWMLWRNNKDIMIDFLLEY